MLLKYPFPFFLEKTNKTKVNQTIWGSSIFCSSMYITFGMLAAMAYKRDSEDMLTLLAGDGVNHHHLNFHILIPSSSSSSS